MQNFLVGCVLFVFTCGVPVDHLHKNKAFQSGVKFSQLDGQRCRGYDWSDSSSEDKGKKSEQVCQKLCSDDKLCNAVDLSPDGVCRLHKNCLVTGQVATGVTCWVKPGQLYAPKEEKAVGYHVTDSFHCGGTDNSIETWKDGTSANYGQLTGIDKCKQKCTSHEDCAGFVFRHRDSICGFWKSGPLAPYAAEGHDCYAKEITASFLEGEVKKYTAHADQMCRYQDWRSIAAEAHSNKEECEHLCSEDVTCRAFDVASDGKCLIHDGCKVEGTFKKGFTCYTKNVPQSLIQVASNVTIY